MYLKLSSAAVVIGTLRVKRNGYTFSQVALSKLLLSHFWNGVYSEKKEYHIYPE